MNLVKELILMGGAGALGTLARYGAMRGVHAFTGERWQLGMLGVNVLGAFLAGFLWMMFECRSDWRHPAANILFVGFLGAFTTFSSIMLESGKLFKNGAVTEGAIYIFLQNISGLAAVLSAVWLAGKLFR